MTTETVIARCMRLGAATLHESGASALPADVRGTAGPSMVAGRARVARGPAGDNYWLHRALYAADPGDVIVFRVAGQPEHGYWGEVMTHAALARGIKGLIINASIRDAARITDLGFPVFATGLSVQGTTKHGRGGSLDGPILIGSASVRTGDIVFGDQDGVVALPANEVDQIVAQGDDREAKESRLIRRLREGDRTIELLGLEDSPTDGPADASSLQDK